MANAIDTARTPFPALGAAISALPAGEHARNCEAEAADWLRTNAGALGNVGETLGKFLIHILIGMIIGGMVVLADPTQGYANGQAAGARWRARWKRASRCSAGRSAAWCSDRCGSPRSTPC